MSDFEKNYQLAQQYFEEQKYREAENLYLKLLNLMPDGCADICNHLGFIKHQAGDLEEAITYFKRALKINPHYTEAALNLVIAYNDTQQYEAASSVFLQAAAEARRDAGAVEKIDPFLKGKLANEHFKLGNTYFELGLLDEAEAQYRKALSMCPNFVDVITRLGITLREKKLFPEAIDTFRMAKAVNRGYTPALIHLGITYYTNGFIDLALKEWEAVRQIDPEGKEVNVYLALAKKRIVAQEEASE